jgi:Zn-dependent peptidase ImmA (M78 family)
MQATDLLTERVHAVVYHATNLRAAYMILKDWRFALSHVAGSQWESELNPKDRPYFLSLTRSRAGDYHAHYASSGSVVFRLNGDWFNQRYRSEPVNYYAGWDRLDRQSEQEDRVFSKKPYIPADAIEEIHILMLEGQTRFESDRIYLRKILLLAKKHTTPVHVYSNKEAWYTQDKRRAMPWSAVKQLISGTEEYQRTWPRTNFLKIWLEAYYKNKVSELSKRAQSLVYNIKYSWRADDIQNLDIDLSNERKPDSTGYNTASKIINILQKKNWTLQQFVQHLKRKWLVIDIAEKHNSTISDIMDQLKQGIAVEKEHTNDPKIAEKIALDHLREMPDYYTKLKKMETDVVSETVNKSSDVLKDFLKFALRKLNITQLPKIKFQKKFSPAHSATFGYFDPDTDEIVITVDNRHSMDVMRTLAHELVHYTQRMNNELENHSGETGSKQENQANAAAGVLMRDFGRQHPEYFEED